MVVLSQRMRKPLVLKTTEYQLPSADHHQPTAKEHPYDPALYQGRLR